VFVPYLFLIKPGKSAIVGGGIPAS
jgi:hypothetical protein